MEEERKDEGKNLDGQNNSDEKEAKTSYTIDEVKEMQANQERGVQKLIAEKKIAEQAIKELSDISDKGEEYLVDVFEKNPEVANKILNDYYDGMNIEDFKQQIGYEEDLSDPEVRKRVIERETQKNLSKIEESKKVEEFISKLQMDEDEKKNFMDELEERKAMKSYKSSDIQSHMEKAWKLSQKTDTTRNNKNIADKMAINTSGGKVDIQKQKTEKSKAVLSSIEWQRNHCL